MKMKFTVLPYLLVLMSMHVSCMADMEPKCSKFDFEEKLLEKMVRMEHQNKLMMEDFMKISQQNKENQQHVNEELVTMKTEFGEIKRQANEDFQQVKAEVQQRVNEDLVTMKTEFGEIKRQANEDFQQVKAEVQQRVNENLVTMKTEFGEIKRQANEDLSKPKKLIEEYLRRPSYAFNAYWLANTNPSNGVALVFQRIQLNEGNVYDSSSGKYTAPLNGTYLFSTTLCFQPAKYAFVHFIADDTLIGAFLAGNSQGRDSHCTSSTVTAFLQKDMDVWLKVYSKSSGTPFYNSENHYHSNFAGHLIKKV